MSSTVLALSDHSKYPLTLFSLFLHFLLSYASEYTVVMRIDIFLLVSTLVALCSAQSQAPPRDLFAYFDDQKVLLSWKAPASGAVSGYTITRPGAQDIHVTTLSTTVTDLQNDVPYQFSIQAKSPTGTSQAIPFESVTPRAAVAYSGASGGLWSDPNNWTPKRVPRDIDLVNLFGRTVKLDQNAVVIGIGNGHIQCGATAVNLVTGFTRDTVTLEQATAGTAVCGLKYVRDVSSGGTDSYGILKVSSHIYVMYDNLIFISTQSFPLDCFTS